MVRVSVKYRTGIQLNNASQTQSLALPRFKHRNNQNLITITQEQLSPDMILAKRIQMKQLLDGKGNEASESKEQSKTSASRDASGMFPSTPEIRRVDNFVRPSSNSICEFCKEGFNENKEIFQLRFIYYTRTKLVVKLTNFSASHASNPLRSYRAQIQQ